MKFQSIVIAILVVFVSVADLWALKPDKQAGTSTEKETSATVLDSNAASTDSTEPKKTPEITHKVVAYYFHGNRRCVSCRKIEAYSREAIESGFAEELKAGKLEWLVINTDESENKHFIKDYQLYTKSLVISDIENGKQTRWKNLDKVWELLRNKEDFIRYVQRETRAFLEED